MSQRLIDAVGALRAERRVGIAPYVTAGDGGLDSTLAVLHALDRAGASVIELGVPFSDPIADGPALQAAAQRALDAGTTLVGILGMVRRFRDEGGRVPLLAFSYLNPLLSGGLDVTCRRLSEAGLDGTLVPDVPEEEAGPLAEACRAHGLSAVLFATPTTSDERIAAAARASRGFLYVVGRVGITGRATTFSDDVLAYLERVRRLAGDLPLGVGFGLREREQVEALAGRAELAIVGTALVQRLHDARARGADPAAEATAFMTELSGG